MITAREQLSKPSSPQKLQKLHEMAKAQPERLRIEFLQIAGDSNERLEIRIGALRALTIFGRTLEAINSDEVVEELRNSFNREFLGETAGDFEAAPHRIATAFLSSDRIILMYVFASAFKTLGATKAATQIETIRCTLKGTFLENELDLLLAGA